MEDVGLDHAAACDARYDGYTQTRARARTNTCAGHLRGLLCRPLHGLLCVARPWYVGKCLHSPCMVRVLIRPVFLAGDEQSTVSVGDEQSTVLTILRAVDLALVSCEQSASP
jgi:hypothetical protein